MKLLFSISSARYKNFPPVDGGKFVFSYVTLCFENLRMSHKSNSYVNAENLLFGMSSAQLD